ncbi:hypothetical protein [Halosolutus halophilus]|uniref:hypothetical protein n=1 Tax=Halosolutus halophilus TaxID=1552990 RepID=UPI002234FE3A|nr:hypothetical protein [Halosolutus halophilus]
MESTNSSPERTDREDVLALLADTIEATHTRIAATEAETVEEQELQIKWIRALGYLVGQYRQLLKDEDLDEMATELDLLRRAADLDERAP